MSAISDATLGIDIGTSAVKVVAVGADGRVRARASRPYPMATPAPGHVEQAPEDWWRATAAAVAEVVAAVGAGAIAGIGLSGQLNGVVLMDTEDRPLGPALIWLDTRAAAVAADLAARHGPLLREAAATELTAIAVLSKLAWLARHAPERLGAAKRALLVKDYILWRLTGTVATDPSDASATGLMDVRRLDWTGALCEAAGIAPALLPPIRPSLAIAGAITSDAAAATGLAAGTPVAPGGGDVAALAVGCGVVEEGVLGVTLGTAGHVVLSARSLPEIGREPGFWPITHADPARTIWLGLVMSGGLSLSWLHRTLSTGDPARLAFPAMTALAEGVPPGARGVSFVPFLEGSATPAPEAAARAGFSGLSSAHGAPEMVQAVMEGVAFNVKDCVAMFERLGGTVREVRVAEGGARVDRWCRIIADVLERPVVRIEELDASSVGAALMAQVAVGWGGLEAVVARTVANGTAFTPTEAHFEACRAAYRRYRRRAATEIAFARSDAD
ncbi:xylulokinase [Prosthecomicrobium pneumaticum]|uniref:Xylulokinase n=1 Tax=Prosthecomicrobium pneumaticum TaxID=81895 RepID=A0A7W9CTE3_9HYPH|nr:FGGY family carbohydrate kinase [Prosthecomicrobium pneumaticum]MBB5751565.1 xylulokinase [Prosthecomicrobium pneumaticum]